MCALKTASVRSAAIIPLLLFLNGCVLGPGSLMHSRNFYNRAVHRTTSEEMLLNLVRLRYGEQPGFTTVSSITDQNTFDASVGGTGRHQETVPTVLGSAFGVGAQTKSTPSYKVEQGQEFTQRLLTPISGETLDLISSKGWSIERFMRLMTRNVNGIDNATNGGGPTPSAKPVYEEFRTFTFLLRQLQVNYPGSFEVAYEEVVIDPPLQLQDPIPVTQVSAEALNEAEERGNRYHVDQGLATLWRKEVKEKVKVLRFRDDVRGTSEFLGFCQVLGLDPSAEHYRVKDDKEGQIPGQHINRWGQTPPLRREVVVSHRSLKEAMFFLSQVVEVPESHIEKGIVQQTLDDSGCPFDWKDVAGDLFQVHSQHFCPHDAAVAVRHKGRWFYIDDSDISSKYTFNLLLELFNLEIRGGGAAQGPLFTI